LWTLVLKLLRGSSRVVLFREFHRFGPNLEIEFRLTFVLDGLTQWLPAEENLVLYEWTWFEHCWMITWRFWRSQAEHAKLKPATTSPIKVTSALTFFKFFQNKNIQKWHLSWIYQTENGQSISILQCQYCIKLQSRHF